ncbi:MAG: hypothetical protein Q9221_001373 [Calogaya cf. arnoldii]
MGMPRTEQDMPPEVIHIILENLSQTDVKQARLVSNRWAAIGARSLDVHTVYLSPRDKDMEVFDVITQHPIFRTTAKHVVFDSAQFIKLSEEHYITAFIRDLEAQAEHYQCPHAQRFIHLLNKPFTESACDTAIFDRDHAHDRFPSVEELTDGFRQYSEKQPSGIMLPGGWGSHHGLSPIVFDVRKWPVFTDSSSVSGRLEVLHVKLTPHINVTGDWETDKHYLSGLKSMISNAEALQELTLSKVLGPAETDTEHGVFNLKQIFPPVTKCLCTSLRKLELHGFPTSYKQLAGLLFLNNPNLKVLRLGDMTLFDGDWEDIVEGLRHLDALQS